MFADEQIAGLCNGSTPDSDSVCEGSNPSPAAKEIESKSSDFGSFSFSQATFDGFLWLRILQKISPN